MPKFEQMIRQQGLWFAAPQTFIDPLDSSYPKGSSNASSVKKVVTEDFDGEWYPGELEGIVRAATEKEKQLEEDVSSTRNYWGVSCWSEGKLEPEPLWNLFSNHREGVAIKTSLNRLRKQLDGLDRVVFIGRVNYCDKGEASAKGGMFKPFFWKQRDPYSIEKEVRAVLPLYLPNEEIEVKKTGKPPKRGVLVPLDLVELVECIVLAPLSATDLKSRVTRLLADANLPVAIQESAFSSKGC